MKGFFRKLFGIILMLIGLASAPLLIGLYIIWIGWSYFDE